MTNAAATLVEYLLVDPQGFYPGTIGIPESEDSKLEVKDGNIHIYGQSGIIAVIRPPLSVVTRTLGAVVKLPVRKM